MLDKILSFFNLNTKKTNDNTSTTTEEQPQVDTKEEMRKAIDFRLSRIKPEPIIDNPDGKKCIIIVDDVEYTEILYRGDLEILKQKYGNDFLNDCKIVWCLGVDAGYIAYDYAVNKKNKVDLGILDITLGHSLLTENGRIAVDGIDIGMFISETNPDFLFLLCTAHTCDKTNQIISKYMKKTEKYFNKTLESLYLNKNDRTPESFYNLIVKI